MTDSALQRALSLLNERIWVEATCMLFHITEPELKTHLETYALHCISGGEDLKIKSTKDIKYHFRSYLYRLTPDERKTTAANIGIDTQPQHASDDFAAYASSLLQGR